MRGRTGKVVMMKPEPLGRFLIVMILGLLLVGCAKESAGPRINVLLITLDTTRADKLGAYGNEEIRTPVIDRIAREGVMFTAAQTAVPLTLPAHSTLMTGMYPPGHGVRNNGNYSLPSGITTLAEILREAGYSTAAFIGAFVLDSQFGLSQGFDVYDDSFGRSSGDQSGYFGYEERGGNEQVDLGLAWLDTRKEPFFLWLHFFDPHYPYDPPAPFDSLYENPYLGEIAFTDSCLGRVIDGLEDAGIMDSTLIIVASDHGESLGEHGEMSHGLFLYRATTHVALLLRYPAALPSGIEIGSPVSLADVLPTVCDLLGLDAPADVQGRNLLRDIEDNVSPPDIPIYMETVYPQENYGWSGITGVLYRDWKYYRVTEPELYHVSEDPDELHNLYGDSTRVVSMMESILDSLETELTLVSSGTARAEFDDETRRKLESLGYVWDESASSPSDVDPKRMVQVVNRIDYGLLLFTKGELEEAAKLFTDILAVDPNNLTAHNMLGISLIKLGRENEALYHWRRVVELKPNSIDARRNIAKVLMGRKLYGEAVEQFETVLDLNPKDTKALIQLGIIAKESGDPSKAEEYFKKVVEIEPENPQSYLLLGDVSRERGSFEQAYSYYIMAFERDSTNIEIREGLGKTSRKLGRGEEAVRHFKWVARQKNDAPSYIRLGNTLDRQGRFEEALAGFRKAIALDSLSFAAYNSMGTTLLALERFEEAEASFKKAVSIRKDYAQPYFNLGNLYRQTGRIDEAEDSYRTFLSLWKGGEEQRRRAEAALDGLRKK